MKIQLTHQESESIFFDALCNGLNELCYYDLDVRYDEDAYREAREKLESPCFEDVLMQMLRDGKYIYLHDLNDEDEVHAINLDKVHENVEKAPLRHLMDAINEDGDATTADVILQTVFLGEVIFG